MSVVNFRKSNDEVILFLVLRIINVELSPALLNDATAKPSRMEVNAGKSIHHDRQREGLSRTTRDDA